MERVAELPDPIPQFSGIPNHGYPRDVFLRLLEDNANNTPVGAPQIDNVTVDMKGTRRYTSAERVSGGER
jgi:hypothetical protein